MHQQSGLVVKSTLFVGYVVYADCLQARSLPTRATATTFHVHSCHNHIFAYLHICITIPFKLPTGATATISHVHSCHNHKFTYLHICITFPFKLPTGATATIPHVHSCHGHMFTYLRVCITFPLHLLCARVHVRVCVRVRVQQMWCVASPGGQSAMRDKCLLAASERAIQATSLPAYVVFTHSMPMCLFCRHTLNAPGSAWCGSVKDTIYHCKIEAHAGNSVTSVLMP